MGDLLNGDVVRCRRCGWMGQRVWRTREDDYGHCPECKERIAAPLRETAGSLRAYILDVATSTDPPSTRKTRAAALLDLLIYEVGANESTDLRKANADLRAENARLRTRDMPLRTSGLSGTRSGSSGTRGDGPLWPDAEWVPRGYGDRPPEVDDE